MGYTQSHEVLTACWTLSGVCHVGSYKSKFPKTWLVFSSSYPFNAFVPFPVSPCFLFLFTQFYLGYHQIPLTHLSSVSQNLFFIVSFPLAAHV